MQVRLSGYCAPRSRVEVLLTLFPACNSLGSLGGTSGVTFQWSGRNPMALVSGCPWWCPICITSSWVSSSGSSRGIHHKCKHPLNPTKLYVSGRVESSRSVLIEES
ncbi:hypothetical protein DEO72_LG11g553 [Vigna unguiculata]|uniref:Uncharacterized protein n=1 Tax=Vigna unguiculata TaxID=3917 RepID=A0A4D6NLT3_VIGUN|nr:hypothetical protein DEO72_LG11g553 [Vigna unguiculata]